MAMLLDHSIIGEGQGVALLCYTFVVPGLLHARLQPIYQTRRTGMHLYPGELERG